MNFVMDPEPQRQILVVANDPANVAELVGALEGVGAMDDLELEPLQDGAVGAVVAELGGAVYHQRKTKASRKQVLCQMRCSPARSPACLLDREPSFPHTPSLFFCLFKLALPSS